MQARKEDGRYANNKEYPSPIAMIYLAVAFLLVAFLYASVGFGGGSTYTALLIESGLDWTLVPPISLMCNLVVVAGGVYHFAKAGHIDLKLATPLIIASIPAAFFGGYARLSETSFLLILGAALFIAGGLLVFDRSFRKETNAARPGPVGSRLLLGAILGGLAGVTGIGGGIYLAPVMHLFRIAAARTVAATCSLFILVNSVSGLAGQVLKLGAAAEPLVRVQYLALPVAVFVGGQLGSRAAAKWLPVSPIRRLTGAVIVLVALRILWQAASAD
jgi:uncharacterized protein